MLFLMDFLVIKGFGGQVGIPATGDQADEDQEQKGDDDLTLVQQLLPVSNPGVFVVAFCLITDLLPLCRSGLFAQCTEGLLRGWV